LPDSPSATAGIQEGDVLVSIGSRQISDYADAANAFFYLVPGKQVQVKLKRGDLLLELNLTPLAPRP
jgi:S1-C subfamily serine protease